MAIDYYIARGLNNYTIFKDSADTFDFAEGMGIRVKFLQANTDKITLTIQYSKRKLNVKSIIKTNGSELVAGDIQQNGIYQLNYDGTKFQIATDVLSSQFINSIEDTTTIDLTVTLAGKLSASLLSFDGFDTDDLTEGATNLYFTDERAQDAVGGVLIDTDTIDFYYLLNTVFAEVRYQMSIISDINGLKLVNDSAAPGNTKYYGTDGGGTKGFHSIPAGYSDAQAIAAVGFKKTFLLMGA